MKDSMELIFGILKETPLGGYKHMNFLAIKDSLKENWRGEVLINEENKSVQLQITRFLETEDGIIALGEHVGKKQTCLDGKKVSEVIFYFPKKNNEDPLTLQKKYTGKDIKKLVELLTARAVLILDTRGRVHEGPGRLTFLEMEKIPNKEFVS